MKFGSKFEQSKIPEWADFYVSYELLRKLLAPFRALKKVFVRSTTNDTMTAIHNFSSQEIEKLEHFSKIFEGIIFEDLEKVLVFYTQQLSSTIAKWKSIRINMMIYKEKKDTLDKHTQTQQYEMLKQAFHILLRELKLLTEYITANLEAFQKIIRKHTKVVKDFAPSDTLKLRLEKYLLESKIFLMRDRLNNFLVSVENEYIRSFFKNKAEGTNAIRQFTQNVLISKNETFWFGLFTGFALLLVILIVVLCVDGGLDIDGNQVLKEVFPIFRGIGLIILYMGFLAWNVYGWTKYHVNYKLIFRFNYHYSQIGQILRRAAIFATILLILLLWYLLVDSQTSKLGKALDFIPKEIIPLFLWVSFLVYMFFPNFKIFNGPGRRYVYNIIKLILKSVFFIPVKFAVIWSTDQLTSFTLPLKDTEYTVCYYIRYFFFDEGDIQQCQSSKRFTKSLIMAVIPVLFRICQCIRQIYDQASNRRDPTINLGKYCFSALVSVLSYLVTLYDSETRFLIAWIVFAAISTAYSYCWDVKKDWGFLEPNSKHKFLRNQLSYHSPSFYYAVIVANLVMRLAWTLSISPDIINKIVRPELITLFVGIIEILRRALWNFLRVEKEHLVNVGSFQAVPKIHLPYENITFQDSTQDDLFNNDLEKIMDNDKKTLVPISMKEYLPAYRRTSLVNMAETYNKISRQTSKIDLHFLSDHQNDKILRNISVIPFKATAIAAMNAEERQQLFKDLQKYREEEQLRYLKWEKEVKQFKILIKQKESQFQIVNTRSEPKVFKDLDKNSHPYQNDEAKPIISYQHTTVPKKSLSKDQQTEAFVNNERVNKLLNQVNAEEKFIWAQDDDHSDKTTPVHSLPKIPKKNYPNVQMLHRIHSIHSNLAALHSGSNASPLHKGDSFKNNVSRPSQNHLIEMSPQGSDLQNRKVGFITIPQQHHEQDSMKLPSPIKLENMVMNFEEKPQPQSPQNSYKTGSPDIT